MVKLVQGVRIIGSRYKITDGGKTFIGYSLYEEEDDEPKLYYVEGYDL